MGKRVLIVDDVEAIARHVRRVVLQAVPSAVVEVFHDVDAARQGARDGPFDLAVLDLHIADQSGAALARELLAAMPGLKLVFVTGEPRSQEAAEARALAPIAVLVKPVAAEELREVIERALDGREE